jgi:hypothetical protein
MEVGARRAGVVRLIWNLQIIPCVALSQALLNAICAYQIRTLFFVRPSIPTAFFLYEMQGVAVGTRGACDRMLRSSDLATKQEFFANVGIASASVDIADGRYMLRAA